jgi:hypothetical protein
MRRVRRILVAVKDPAARALPLLIGNTAERVLDHLSCGLLVIKTRGFRGKVPRRRRGACYVSPPGVPFY